MPREHALLEYVAEYYELARPVLVQQLGMWGENVRWKIRHAGDTFALLKESPFYLEPDEQSFHVLLHRHVQSAGGPVLKLKTTLDGEPFFRIGHRTFELQEWFDGRHLDPLLIEDHEILGELIGAFQLASIDFEHEFKRDWVMPSRRAVFCPTLPAELHSAVDVIEQGLDSMASEENELIDALRAWLDQDRALTLERDLPQQFVHGDPGYYNSLVGAGGSAVLVDLDNAHWNWRIADVALVLGLAGGLFVPEEGGRGSSVRASWDVSRMQRILRGFEKYVLPTQAEREALPWLVGARLIESAMCCLNLDGFSTYPIPSDFGDQLRRLPLLLSSVDRALN